MKNQRAKLLVIELNFYSTVNQPYYFSSFLNYSNISYTYMIGDRNSKLTI